MTRISTQQQLNHLLHFSRKFLTITKKTSNITLNQWSQIKLPLFEKLMILSKIWRTFCWVLKNLFLSFKTYFFLKTRRYLFSLKKNEIKKTCFSIRNWRGQTTKQTMMAVEDEDGQDWEGRRQSVPLGKKGNNDTISFWFDWMKTNWIQRKTIVRRLKLCTPAPPNLRL